MGLTWMAIGDSITAGTGATVYANSYLYQTRVGLLSQGKEHHLIKAAESGQRTDQLIELHKARGGKCDPDLVTILTGANDVNQSYSTTTFQTNLDLLVKEVKKRLVNGQGQIVLLTIPWENNSYNANIPGFNTVIQNYGTANNIPVCDIYPAYNSASSMFDTIHPNDSGHAAIANILTPFLSNLSVWSNVRTRG